ncbi:MAG: hypothetical protein GX493_04290 [Firmicutes bacterium]|nr:hypothetical protein [Bacillota bacterium]
MKLWGDRPISQRIILSFITVAVATVMLMLIAILGTLNIANINRAIVSGHEKRSYVAELDAAVTDAEGRAGYLKRIVTNRPEEITPADDMTIKMMAIRLEEAAKKVRPVIVEMMAKQAPYFDETVAKVLENTNHWEKSRNYSALVGITGALEELKFLSGELRPKLLEQINRDLQAAHANLTRTTVLIIVFSLLIVSTLFVTILPVIRELRLVFIPMRQASETALRGANNVMSYAAEIDELIDQLQKAMDEVGRATQEVATATQESANLLGEIMNSVRNTGEATGHLSEEATTIYDSLAAHQSLLEERSTQVREMVAQVENLLGGITQNAAIAEGLAVQVTALREQLAGIEGFLASMNDITDQTELLALNASIEAARAGEEGVGFMVVAERLRKLSDQTKGFTAQIEATVTKLQESTMKVASALTQIIASVRAAVDQVGAVTHEFSSFEDLLASLQKAHGRIIAAANAQMEKTREIYRSATEIMRSVENISAQTEEVSAAMEELSAESEQVIGQIQHISQNMEETRTAIERQVELAKMAKEAADRF